MGIVIESSRKESENKIWRTSTKRKGCERARSTRRKKTNEMNAHESYRNKSKNNVKKIWKKQKKLLLKKINHYQHQKLYVLVDKNFSFVFEIQYILVENQRCQRCSWSTCESLRLGTSYSSTGQEFNVHYSTRWYWIFTMRFVRQISTRTIAIWTKTNILLYNSVKHMMLLFCQQKQRSVFMVSYDQYPKVKLHPAIKN